MSSAQGKVDTMRMVEGYGYLVGFASCIPLANWAVGHLGDCSSSGPCVVPVAPGLEAPSGVLFIGLALVLRDLVQRRLGVRGALVAILLGTALSAAISPGPLWIASASAFIFSELADFAVYTPLQRRGLVLAVLGSSAVGLVIDSLMFLELAFGSFDFLAGQVVGKLWMVLVALPAVAWLRRRDALLGTPSA